MRGGGGGDLDLAPTRPLTSEERGPAAVRQGAGCSEDCTAGLRGCSTAASTYAPHVRAPVTSLVRCCDAVTGLQSRPPVITWLLRHPRCAPPPPLPPTTPIIPPQCAPSPSVALLKVAVRGPFTMTVTDTRVHRASQA